VAPDASTTATQTGTCLADRYELGRLIARGGMADVFEARDQLLDRRVAVKVFRAAEAADRDRFDAEVRLLAGLNHPGLVPVYDAGEHGGDGFMVLELVEGPTLRTTLTDRGPMPEREVAALGATLAEALDHVHGRGIVHRDLTPANVLCGPDGTPRLTDFGIARLLDTTRVTAEHLTIGTVGYMAPEQVEGRDVTPAADVYALGLVLLEALTGAPAFSGPSHEVAIARLARDPAVPDDLADPWPDLLRSMTARRPEDRPAAGAVAASLRHGRPLDASAAASAVVAPPSPGRSVVRAPEQPVDPSADTAALPVAETGPPPEGVAPGRAPTKTTVMPAVLRPAPDAAESDAPAGLAGAARPAAPAPAVEPEPGDRPSSEKPPLGAVLAAGGAGVAATVGSAGHHLRRRARRLTFHQWVAALAAAAFVFAVWQSGGGSWSAQLEAAQVAAYGEAVETDPAPTTTETSTTTAAPAPPPVIGDDDDDGDDDEGPGGRGEGRDRGEGKGKKDKGDDDDD
jgi:tRNA A-37 threonylcarbamoyl transferase component Bud32